MIIDSTIGWGAMCQGVKTGRPRSQQERGLHINVLESTAAVTAVQTFAQHTDTETHSPKNGQHLRMSEGTYSLDLMRVACTLWD